MPETKVDKIVFDIHDEIREQKRVITQKLQEVCNFLESDFSNAFEFKSEK